MTLREERAEDAAAIRRVNEAAFVRPDEADLVDALRAEGAVLCSLVAELDAVVAGHILFSRMWIDHLAGSIPAVALAPMAVLPECQGRGIGSALVVEGLNRLCGMHERIVLVLGHEHYYPGFGFSSEKARKLASPFPPEAFMALELEPRAVAGITGRVRYATAFAINSDGPQSGD